MDDKFASPRPEPGASPRAAPNRQHKSHHRNGQAYRSRRSYGALDLGTNNCRLLIARPAEDGFTVIDAFSRIVRLGEGLSKTGRLSDAAIDRSISALSICADKLRRRHVSLARSVATEACRRAANGRYFVRRVREETGIALDIISPREEARLAVLGCHILLEPGDGPALIFDIGGGSTELVLIEPNGLGEREGEPQILSWYSAPWGVVSLAEKEFNDLTTLEDRLDTYQRMRNRVAKSFADFASTLPTIGYQPRLLGTSGTVTTLASVHLKLPSYDRSKIDGLVLPSEALRAVSTDLAHKSVPERAEIPCIGAERADLVVAGCAILEAILDIWPAERIGIADRGIREGILRSMMAADR
ncbi:Ppx/GppA phosphatase family protein [Parasphingopyxis sp.]|uniref:Ppx/GppA phosphatase family protein n=1 Tax=Parasphingopyxis sp. TaxID=1920299 RepID=UPI002625D4BE|nr:Ppx/GppA phosphatase family protein [Parasphingopyxis sp.]